MVKGVKYLVTEGDWTVGGEHTRSIIQAMYYRTVPSKLIYCY